MLAGFFGTGIVNGAYRVAQTGTLVPINFLTSDSLNSAFIPLYKQYIEYSKNKAQTLVWGILTLFLCFSMFLLLMAIFFSGEWVNILAPGLDSETYTLSKNMLQVMAIGIPFYILSALVNYISMANDDFVPMSVRPSLQNFGMLLGAVFAYYFSEPIYLAWGFTFCYMVFFVWTLFRIYTVGGLEFPAKFDKTVNYEIAKQFWITLKPLLLLPLLLQGNIAVERGVASLISLEAVSAIDYARFITETVLFMISMPVAFAGLSSWSGKTAGEIKSELVKIYSVLIYLSVPTSIFLYLNAESIVKVMFARGSFNSDSVLSTSQILIGMSLGLWAQVIGYVFIKSLNAQFMNRSVLKIMFLALAGNALVNVLLYKYLGPLTLGIGCSIYGIVLLLCSVYYLKIFRFIIGDSIKIFILSIFYIAIYFFTRKTTQSVTYDLLVNGVIFTIFWGITALTYREFRKFVADKIIAKFV